MQYLCCFQDCGLLDKDLGFRSWDLNLTNIPLLIQMMSANLCSYNSSALIHPKGALIRLWSGLYARL